MFALLSVSLQFSDDSSCGYRVPLAMESAFLNDFQS
jgi:hypothetical protein